MGTMVRYNFLPEAAAGAPTDSEVLASHLTSQEVNSTKEEVTLSFSASSAPAILMYVSSRTEDYMAVVLRHNGERSVRGGGGSNVMKRNVDADSIGTHGFINLGRGWRSGPCS